MGTRVLINGTRYNWETNALLVGRLVIRPQSPQDRPRTAAAATNRITHCPERLQRPPINPKRQFLAARLPPPRMRPVINLRRTQHFSAARYESAPDPHLHRTAALGWRRRPVTQVTMVRPFHRGPRPVSSSSRTSASLVRSFAAAQTGRHPKNGGAEAADYRHSARAINGVGPEAIGSVTDRQSRAGTSQDAAKAAIRRITLGSARSGA
jgi:hypothetical protein